MPEPVRSRRRLDGLYGAHFALVLALGLGRLLRAVEDARAASESSFAASTAGRALALLAMVAAIPASIVVLWASAREFRDPKVLLLLVLLACALFSRRGPDAFDVLYAVAATALAAHWFARGRRFPSVPPGRPDAPGERGERESV
jgi:hypothetical protein